ncbi:MAG: hypothetical protein J6J42_04060 [Lachnospiraceae bacterium]|nr:hypothetical protein [Lachnospiraceae bacterium]
MIKIENYTILKNHMSNLKETSKDKHDNGEIFYMTESLLPAVNFDEVKDEYIKHLSVQEVPKSNDALIEDGKGRMVFVEFKNGYMDRPKQFSVRKKIYDSALIFTDILSIGISKMRTFVDYVLVYNEEVNQDIKEEKKKYVQPSPSFDVFAKTVSGLAKEEYVGFGVNIFKNYCFREVHTYTEKEFEKFLKDF